MDFAQRAHDHNYDMDPIARSLTDTDFYKLLMLQFIWRRHRKTRVEFQMNNRTKDVALAEIIPIEAIREQFDAARALRFTRTELVQIRGQSYYGQEGIFAPDFVEYLRGFQLPEYSIDYETVANGPYAKQRTGQYDIRFGAGGFWAATSPWELHALTIVNELRNRVLMKDMSKSELDIMYARAKVKLYAKLQVLANDPTLEGISVSDFGTRRRHSFLWQEYVVQTMAEVLGDRFGGTSNVHLAMKHGYEARGTNAHELPMVYAALAETDEELLQAPYKLCADWQDDTPQALRIMLPDTFGTTSFFNKAPPVLASWAGVRPDSKKCLTENPADSALEEIIKFFEDHDVDASTKLAIPSDGLDVEVPGFKAQGENIPDIYRRFKGRIRMSFGWGTNATNDFVGCHPSDPYYMKPISLVCKVKSANGRPAVKLSDNYNKATGPAEEVQRYRNVFGTAGQSGAPVTV